MTALGRPGDLDARLRRYAAGLVELGAIQTDPVRRAFATVPRHRFLPTFFHGADRFSLATSEMPPEHLLEVIYANNALLTHKGQDGDPSSSSSGPSVMARMLEALRLQPGMRVLEIGAGTGYNAALITEITGAQVTTIEAGRVASANATAAIAKLGLAKRVQVMHRDGHRGDPGGGRYDRIIVTCGIAGIPPEWLDQLTAGGMILAPVAHAGAHPILALHPGADVVAGRCVLWADFMPAAGALRPAALFGHQPHVPIPAAGVRRLPGALPALDDAQCRDRTFFFGVHDPRATRAYLDRDDLDPAHGTTALVEHHNAAWAQTTGDIVLTGDPAATTPLHARLIELSTAWDAAGRPEAAGWECRFEPAEASSDQLLTPSHWQRPAEEPPSQPT